MWVNFSGKGAFAGGLVATVMVFVLPFYLRYLIDNRIASIGLAALDFHGKTGTRRIRFDQIEDVIIETTRVNFFSQRHVAIKCAGGGFGRMRISEFLLEQRAGGIEGVLELIANGPAEPQQRRAQPARWIDERASPAPAPAAVASTGPRTRTFGRKPV